MARYRHRKPFRPDVNTSDIIRLYQSGLGVLAVGRRLGLSANAVAHRLKRSGQTLRGARLYETPTDEEVLSAYNEHISVAEVGRRFGRSRPFVKGRLRAMGVTIRPFHVYKQIGEQNKTWKGGRFVAASGYVKVRTPGSAVARPEHRVIVEKMIGRPLTKEEIVHHLNGIRSDNRPENLVVTNRKDHEHHTYVKCLQRRIAALEHELSHVRHV